MGQGVRGHRVSHYPRHHGSLFIAHQKNTSAGCTHIHLCPTTTELLQWWLQGNVLHIHRNVIQAKQDV